MSSEVGNLSSSIKRQIEEKTLRAGRQWAYDIVEAHARGEYRGGVYGLKIAREVVAERAAIDGIKPGPLPPRLNERDAQALLDAQRGANP